VALLPFALLKLFMRPGYPNLMTLPAVLRGTSLFLLSIMLLMLSLFNFSLGIFFSVFRVPIYAFIKVSTKKTLGIMQFLVILIFNPIVLWCVARWLFPSVHVTHWLRVSVAEYYIVGNHMPFIIFCLFYPMNLLVSTQVLILLIYQ
jgi:hypothetical protein